MLQSAVMFESEVVLLHVPPPAEGSWTLPWDVAHSASVSMYFRSIEPSMKREIASYFPCPTKASIEGFENVWDRERSILDCPLQRKTSPNRTRRRVSVWPSLVVAVIVYLALALPVVGARIAFHATVALG